MTAGIRPPQAPDRHRKISNPYSGVTDTWLKGEIHTHVNKARNSHRKYEDGEDSDTIYAAAAAAGLQFVCMSVDVTEANGGAGCFGETSAEDTHGVIGIPGREIQNNYYALEGSPTLPDTDYFSEPGSEYLHVLTIGDGGISICLHPRYYEIVKCKAGGCWNDIRSALLNPKSNEHLAKLEVSGIEVYNGFTLDRLQKKNKEYRYSDYDEMCWDEMLMEGRRYWGFAGNDSFFGSADDFDSFSHLGVVYAGVRGDPSAAKIVDALKRGRFYSSTGVKLVDEAPVRVTVEQEGIQVEVSASGLVNWTAKVFGHGERGWQLSSQHRPQTQNAEFHIDGWRWKYVRIQCEKVRDPWQRAWLQPITNDAYWDSDPRSESRSDLYQSKEQLAGDV